MDKSTAKNGHILPLVVSMGEPAGIGPEVILKAWQARETKKLSPFFVIGDESFFNSIQSQLGLNVPIICCTVDEVVPAFETGLPIVQLDGAVTSTPGELNSADAHLVSNSIIQAVGYVFEGKASGIVTAPINKKALYESGFQYPGHTEFLGALAEKHIGKSVTPIMMLAGPELRTIPVTIHIPLHDVPKTLTTQMIIETGEIAARDLVAKFGLTSPRLAITGVNPHAGEGGTMGHEDADIIAPAVAALKALGIDARGPLPADTMFHKTARETYDVALCMYHDQALIPAKTLGFDDSVNVTLGLPFIRTSPDHGTALDIAGKGIANPSSMIAAIKMAGEMAEIQTLRNDLSGQES
ncbi:MAG: 4-hydroxythreonine-4-phosphate dehydrogenase PdxA [Salaquimonas sp.]